MSENDLTDKKSTWPPPQLAHEKGNNDETVVVHVSHELLRLLLDSGSAMIDDPTSAEEDRS